MKISEHFDSIEFGQPARHGFGAHGYPEEWFSKRLFVLCVQLEVVRDVLGKPIKILSGFRSEEYNRKIGGARLSQHVQGRASDIVVPGMTAAAVHKVVLELYNTGKLPHLTGLGKYPGFCHLDVRPGSRLARWEGSRRES